MSGMDVRNGVATDRSVLLAMAMVGAFGAWVFYQSKHKRKLKVILYYEKGDPYFEDFKAGIVAACHERNIMLDFFFLDSILGSQITNIMMEEIAGGDADAYICRIPNAAVDNVLRATRKPYVSAFSDYHSDTSTWSLDIEPYRLTEKDLLVVDRNQRYTTATTNDERLLKTDAEKLLEDVLNATRNTEVERILVASPGLVTPHTMKHLRHMSFKNVVVIPPAAEEKGRAAVQNIF